MDLYLKAAFDELFAEDGLMVMGRGLGIDKLFGKFAQYHSHPGEHRKLVFCLNCTGIEDQLASLFMASFGALTDHIPQVINNEMPVADRVEKYVRGGCYIITSRILIVDLLDGKVDATSIAGLLIYNAHRISETCVESFIIKVYRERNRVGFVKAFSEEPEALQGGFGKTERLLRTLYVKKLFLWPRFRLEVVETLKISKEPEVIELVCGLSTSMKTIQSAILAAMNSCILELKKSTPQLETSQMTLENGLFQAFDFAIKTQLESEWYRTPQRTKQLVADVGMLRKLLDYLIRYDAFAFYYLLMKLQQASTDQATPSLWLTSEAANQIFKKAKDRVYRVVPVPPASATTTTASGASVGEIAELRARMARAHGLNTMIQPSGECPPKWKLAVDIVKEIKEEYRTRAAQSRPMETAHARFCRLTSQGRVLCIVKDSMAQAQLRDVLVAGVAPVCDRRYRWFVSQQAAEIRTRVRKHRQQQAGGSRKESAAKRAGAGTSESAAGPAAKAARGEDGSRHAFLYPNEQDLMGGNVVTADAGGGAAGLPSSSRAGGEGEAQSFGLPAAWFATLPAESKMLLIEEHCLRLSPGVRADNINAATSPCPTNSTIIDLAEPTSSESASSEGEDGRVACTLDPDLHLMLITHSEVKGSFTTLQDCSPAYVVLFDPDVSIIRAIETYQSALPPSLPSVRVYFVMYEGSGEEHRYAGALVKEKKAFENLIASKEHMVISLPDHPADVVQEAQAGALAISMDTRTVQRGSSSRGKRAVVVDVRDFRCTLPSALYVSGRFSVVPRTLYVGDYVLSPEICVERKGIADLFQSFASGRLYNQAESMLRHYKHPCLLIEFAQDKAFCLLAANEMSPDILQHAITSRIALLALSFPNLRILWSRCATSTVEIFKSLVTNHDEVDVDRAVAAGSLDGGAGADGGDRDEVAEELGIEEEDPARRSAKTLSAGAAAVSARAQRGSAAGELSEESARASAQEVLLSLPGVNVHNYRDIMNAVTNLAELSTMTVEQLQPLVGPVNGKKLHSFFWQNT